MKNVSIENLKGSDWGGYNDGDIIVVDSLYKICSDKNSNVYIDFLLFILCTDGVAEIVIEGKRWTLQKNEALVCPPNTFIDKYDVSKDFVVKIIGASRKSIDANVYINRNIWKQLFYLGKHPLIKFSSEQLVILSHYLSLMDITIRKDSLVSKHDIIHHLTAAMLHELWHICTKQMGEINIQNIGSISQGDVIFKRFMEILTSRRGSIRSVTEVANEIGVTSKYLSVVIKKVSGKNALQLIHEQVTNEIIRRLKYTDDSIQEISKQMNFPSVSFFGKYFKSQTGISPKQYRQRGGILYE